MWSNIRTASLARAAALALATAVAGCAVPEGTQSSQASDSGSGWVYAPGDDSTSGSEPRIIDISRSVPSSGTAVTAKQQK